MPRLKIAPPCVMDKETLETVILFVICGIAAAVLMRKFWPLFLPRELGETTKEVLIRTVETIDQERLNRRVLFGSAKKTITVHLVNFVLLVSMCHLLRVFTGAGYIAFAYLLFGLTITKTRRVIRPEKLAGLRWDDQLWLRIFHAWFWPLYIWAWSERKTA